MSKVWDIAVDGRMHRLEVDRHPLFLSLWQAWVDGVSVRQWQSVVKFPGIIERVTVLGREIRFRQTFGSFELVLPLPPGVVLMGGPSPGAARVTMAGMKGLGVALLVLALVCGIGLAVQIALSSVISTEPYPPRGTRR